jgi:CRP-like cAMP-binding protein
VLADDAANDLFVVVKGTINLVVRLADGTEYGVVDFEAGDVLGVVDHRSIEVGSIVAVAATDCELVSIPAASAGLVISRSPSLSGALDQLAASRQRRIGRIVRRHRAVATTSPTTNEGLPLEYPGSAGDEADTLGDGDS